MRVLTLLCVAIPVMACHAAGYDLGDSAFAWARPPLTGPGGAGIRLAREVPDETAIPYPMEALRDQGVPPALLGLWGPGEPEDPARDGPMTRRGLSLIRQVLRLDAADLAGPGRVHTAPDGWYPPLEELPAWQAALAGIGPANTAYMWPLVGELALCDGSVVAISGRVAVQGAAVALALNLAEEDGGRVDFARQVAAAAVAWPRGLEAIGGGHALPALGGSAWVSGAQGERRVLGASAWTWPLAVTAWAGGREVLVAVDATVWGSDSDPAGSAHRLRSADGPALVAGLVPYRPRVCPLTPVVPGEPGLLSRAPERTGGPPHDLPTVAGAHFEPLPPDAHAVAVPPADAWSEAQVEPAPEIVRRYLDRPDLPPSLTLTSGGPDARRTSVLYRIEDAWGDLKGTDVWCSLGRDFLTVTVLNRDPGRVQWETRDFLDVFDVPTLTQLFGWRGRAISSAPVTYGRVGDTEWRTLAPDPAHEVGILERVRVDQTEWGRCRVYKGYHIYHVVFDLLPEDVADR